MAMKTKPCPFCQNPNAPENDAGDACCFCDYTGEVTIGRFGVFSTIDQYNKVYFASGHQNRLDELHGRNDKNRRTAFDIYLEYDNRRI